MRGERMREKNDVRASETTNTPISVMAADSKSGPHERQIVGMNTVFLYRFLIFIAPQTRD
ncbi:hypothetical protein [Ralstonia pseudosolanacearum]|uniref:hypothetical protein n=1 Tax=Ralstonia pseudosolanacearum TaxID=1310165 RepID=UPI000AC27CE0|nr:hypothetical protein [Ralstonia pseudosolanacearum]